MRTRAAMHIIEHPLVQRDVTVLRDRATPSRQFRAVVGQIGGYDTACTGQERRL